MDSLPSPRFFRISAGGFLFFFSSSPPPCSFGLIFKKLLFCYNGMGVIQMDTAMQKRMLRREMRKRQAALSPAYIRSAGERITAAVLGSALYREADTVFLYLSTPAEPPTGLLLRRALADGKKVFVPKCVGREMLAVRLRDPEALRPGFMGIPEPAEIGETASGAELDLILVPCLAASPDGRRLGHGGGYYDRFLSGRREGTLCLCFREMLCPEIPMEDTDVFMSHLATEAGLKETGAAPLWPARAHSEWSSGSAP